MASLKVKADPQKILFGRDKLLRSIQSEISQGENIVLVGSEGVGKTHLLKHLKTKKEALYLQTGSLKNLVLLVLKDFGGRKFKSSMTLSELLKSLLDFVNDLPGEEKPLLLIDDLDKLKVSEVNHFLRLLDEFQVLSTATELNPRLKKIWWHFKEIKIAPLDQTAAEELIDYLSSDLMINDRQYLKHKVLRLSGGLPRAILNSILRLSRKRVVTRAAIEALHHEAGISYRHWSNSIIIFWGLIVAYRFLALGSRNYEAYIWAGFGTAVMIVLRSLVMKMR